MSSWIDQLDSCGVLGGSVVVVGVRLVQLLCSRQLWQCVCSNDVGVQWELQRRVCMSCRIDELHGVVVSSGPVLIVRCRIVYCLCGGSVRQCQWSDECKLQRSMCGGIVWSIRWSSVVELQWQLHSGIRVSDWVDQLDSCGVCGWSVVVFGVGLIQLVCGRQLW